MLNEKGTATMKLTTITMVTLDGVMQGLGGADEDRRGGFERCGWVPSVFDNEAMAFLNQVYQRADAFLFGRRTYEIFARSWGAWPDPGDHPIWKALNTQPKYVASTTLTEPRWANTTVLSGDVCGRRRRAESQAGRRAAGAWQRRPDPVAARQPACRRDHPAHRPGGRRPGHAAIPRHRPGHRA